MLTFLPWGQGFPHTPKSCIRFLVSGQNKKGLLRCVSIGWGQGSCFKRLATFQVFNTSLEIHNGVKSTPATELLLDKLSGELSWWHDFSKGRFSVLFELCREKKAVRMCWLRGGVYLPTPPAAYTLFLWATAQVFMNIPAMHTAHTAKKRYWVTAGLPGSSDLGSKVA